MSGIKNLQELLESINPETDNEEYVFLTINQSELSKLQINPKLLFEEKEGLTIIITKKEADDKNLQYENVWSLITLNVHSDLEAVGFLAKITDVLAKNKISVNVVSAYYHDHLFVKINHIEDALKILKASTKQTENSFLN